MKKSRENLRKNLRKKSLENLRKNLRKKSRDLQKIPRFAKKNVIYNRDFIQKLVKKKKSRVYTKTGFFILKLHYIEIFTKTTVFLYKKPVKKSREKLEKKTREKIP